MESYTVTFTVDAHDRADVDLFVENVLDATKFDVLGWTIKNG